MTILSLLNFVGIWIPAVVSALYAGLMKQLNPEYIVTMNTHISGLRIGFFVMLLNLLVNVATFSNGNVNMDRLMHWNLSVIRIVIRQKSCRPLIRQYRRKWLRSSPVVL